MKVTKHYENNHDRLYHDPKTGRTWQHEGYATRIHWNGNMLSFLRRHFATTLNEELAGCLGVSQRTMIRKARELGLEKDPEWLLGVWNERRHLAHAAANRKGNPGSWKKGQRYNPDGEFKKGHRESEETKAKRVASIKRWCRMNPKKVMERAAKVWATRRRNMEASASA